MTKKPLVALLVFSTCSAAVAQTSPPPPRVDLTNIVFPADAGVIDVTKAPYFASPSAGNDDTAAIQQALTNAPEGSVIYFPNGTYDISDAKLRDGTNVRGAIELKNTQQRIILQGQSESKTILRLKDSVSSSFGNSVVSTFTGTSAGNSFRNSIRNLTVSVGQNHPNVTGISYVANNQGSLSSVTITSEDGNGAIGLDAGAADTNGPALVRNLSVKGFGYGIRSRFDSSSIVFDTLDLRNQKISGWDIQLSANAQAYNVTAVNNVPSIWVGGSCSMCQKQGALALQNAALYSVTSGVNEAAIRSDKSLYVRDIRVFGYARSIRSSLDFQRGNGYVYAPYVDEYWANGAYTSSRRGGPFELFPSPDTSLKLVVNDPPVIPWTQDFTKWTGPQKFGGVPDDNSDDTAAFVSALSNSSADTLYIPPGRWRIQGTLNIPANINRIIAIGSRIDNAVNSSGSRIPAELVIQASSNPLEISGIEGDLSASITVRHSSTRTLHLSSILGLRYQANTNNTSGSLYLTDISLPQTTFYGQNVWARQLNAESGVSGTDAKITNVGGKLWVLGFKTEKLGTTLKTTQGGRTEVLGALHSSDADSVNPRFVTVESSLFTTQIRTVGAGSYTTIYSETRGGQTRKYPSTLYPANYADAYTGFSDAAIRDKEVILDAREYGNTSITGTWQQRSEFPGGFLTAYFLFDGDDSNRAKQITFTPVLPADGLYEIYTRWPNEVSGFSQSPNVRYRVTTATGSADTYANQKNLVGTWVSLGTYNLLKTTAKVDILNNGTVQGQGNTIADGIRFVRR
jgi:hypothetical protein